MLKPKIRKNNSNPQIIKTMEEFNQSVKATLYEGAKKPFTGTFILAWIASNWKILVTILFINEEHLHGITRIEYIEKLELLGFSNLVWKPLVITVAAIVLFGIFNIFASLLVLKFKNYQFTHIDKRTKIDAADYGKLLDELKNIKDKWAKEIESINTSRASLMKSNNNYAVKFGDQNEEIRELKKALDQSEKKLNDLRSYADSYLVTMKRASEILYRYKEDHGTIKRGRAISKTINNLKGNKSLGEIMLGIDKTYDDFIK